MKDIPDGAHLLVKDHAGNTLGEVDVSGWDLDKPMEAAEMRSFVGNETTKILREWMEREPAE